MSYGYSPSYPPTQFDYGYAEPTRRSAPASVHVVAIMQYLGGLVLLVIGAVAAVYALGGERYLAGTSDTDIAAEVRGIGLAIGAVLVFGGLLSLVIGRKVQRGRQWARVLVLVLSVLSVAGTLYTGLVRGGETNALTGLVVPVLYLVLLNTSAARSWFRSHTY
jgi:drug/metabolite transporter (DMT)-like permease